MYHSFIKQSYSVLLYSSIECLHSQNICVSYWHWLKNKLLVGKLIVLISLLHASTAVRRMLLTLVVFTYLMIISLIRSGII